MHYALFSPGGCFSLDNLSQITYIKAIADGSCEVFTEAGYYIVDGASIRDIKENLSKHGFVSVNNVGDGSPSNEALVNPTNVAAVIRGRSTSQIIFSPPNHPSLFIDEVSYRRLLSTPQLYELLAPGAILVGVNPHKVIDADFVTIFGYDPHANSVIAQNKGRIELLLTSGQTLTVLRSHRDWDQFLAQLDPALTEGLSAVPQTGLQIC